MSPGTTAPRVAERLYYDSPELTFRAEVTDIQLVGHEQTDAGAKQAVWRVALDRTAFYPESGGQPWDMGVLVATAPSGATLEAAVERVEEDEAGEVWHFVRKPLVQGTEVQGRVDAGRRMDHMQQHSGQHLLSAMFLDRLGARTVSFHLGAESSTIDLALPEGKVSFSPDDLAEVEAEVNRRIFEDRVLRPAWYSPEEAQAMLARGQLRKLPERSGPMRIVEMDGIEWNACGGTHVRSTGAIGGLVLRRVEKVKQGWRVEFLCGLRAVRSARNDFAVLSATANDLSIGIPDVRARVAGLQQENKAGAKAHRMVLDELAEAKAVALVAAAPVSRVVQALYEQKSADFAKRVASVAAASQCFAVIGAIEDGQGAIAVALPAGDPRHAGNLLREIGGEYGARGGGGAQLAQGVCDAAQLPGLVAAVAARFV